MLTKDKDLGLVIASEVAEPILSKYMGQILFAVGKGTMKAGKAKEKILAINWFVDTNCGIHARYAYMNESKKWLNMTDEKLTETCRCVVSDMTEDEYFEFQRDSRL